jgi:transcriptional antiterminator NusG
MSTNNYSTPFAQPEEEPEENHSSAQDAGTVDPLPAATAPEHVEVHEDAPVTPPEPPPPEKKKPEPPAAKKAPEPEAAPPAAEEPPKDDKKRWYVVKVQSGREDSIKEAIERRVKIEALEEYFGEILIPMDKETVVKEGKRMVRERKRYPGYIMARVEFNDQILYLFRETSGVGDFVGGAVGQPPLPMSEREVQQMLGPTGRDKPAGPVHEPSPFTHGERVKIRDGVFAGMEGDVKEVLENKGMVRIDVMVLGRPVGVELEYWQVEHT